MDKNIISTFYYWAKLSFRHSWVYKIHKNGILDLQNGYYFEFSREKKTQNFTFPQYWKP